MTDELYGVVAVSAGAVLAFVFFLCSLVRDEVRELEKRVQWLDEWRKQVSKELDLHIQWMRATQDELNASKAKEPKT